MSESKRGSPNVNPPASPAIGVRIAGTGHCVPETRLTNADLERTIDTTNEWIVQRTGILERRVCDPSQDESVRTLSVKALRGALADARMDAPELDLVILASVTGETRAPAVACRIAAEVGAGHAGAFDVIVGCSGFVYTLNLAHSLIRSGAYRAIGVVGCDVMTSIVDPSDRRLVILFGDAAGAAILRATDDASKGVLAQVSHADGARWTNLYIPILDRDLAPDSTWAEGPPGCLRMNGRQVYKFAVNTFSRLIEETLAQIGLNADDVNMYIPHQSNARILETARAKFGIPREKMYVNIDRFGNCSAGSIPLCLSQLRQAERIDDGDIVMFIAFGAGLTWGSSLWRI